MQFDGREGRAKNCFASRELRCTSASTAFVCNGTRWHGGGQEASAREGAIEKEVSQSGQDAHKPREVHTHTTCSLRYRSTHGIRDGVATAPAPAAAATCLPTAFYLRACMRGHGTHG